MNQTIINHLSNHRNYLMKTNENHEKRGLRKDLS